jgi:SPX domain protein involved in polyphosphate accumulation
MREQYLPQKDFSCCRHSVNIEAECVEDYEDLFTPFDDLNNLSQDDGDEEAMLNLVESLDEDYEENFIYVFPESINIMEILDELCNQSCETVQQREENKIIQ